MMHLPIDRSFICYVIDIAPLVVVGVGAAAMVVGDMRATIICRHVAGYVVESSARYYLRLQKGLMG